MTHNDYCNPIVGRHDQGSKYAMVRLQSLAVQSSVRKSSSNLGEGWKAA